MVAEQERLMSERDKAIGECDRLMAETMSASSEHSEVVQQRRELMAERDQLLAQYQAMQTEHDKVGRRKKEGEGKRGELLAETNCYHGTRPCRLNRGGGRRRVGRESVWRGEKEKERCLVCLWWKEIIIMIPCRPRWKVNRVGREEGGDGGGEVMAEEDHLLGLFPC